MRADSVSSVGELELVTCEPDTESTDNDGVYISFEYLGQLIRRANGQAVDGVHCAGCQCA